MAFHDTPRIAWCMLDISHFADTAEIADFLFARFASVPCFLTWSTLKESLLAVVLPILLCRIGHHLCAPFLVCRALNDQTLVEKFRLLEQVMIPRLFSFTKLRINCWCTCHTVGLLYEHIGRRSDGDTITENKV